MTIGGNMDKRGEVIVPFLLLWESN